MHTFFPMLPSPLPPLDFCPIQSAIGATAPVVTRSMTIKTSDISQFYDQVPLYASTRSNDNSDSSASCQDDNTDDSNDPEEPPSSSLRIMPTTTTPSDRPSLPVYYKQLSSAPKLTLFTTQQLHSLLGSRSLKNWNDINEISLPTVSISNSGVLPIELGDVVNLKAARKNKTPVPKPPNFLDVVHGDLAYGDCTSVGGVRYALLLVDRSTRFSLCYGLKSLIQEEILQGFVKFQLTFGSLPRRLYTDFDHRLLSGQIEKFLNQHGTNILGAPASRQYQNGLVERQ